MIKNLTIICILLIIFTVSLWSEVPAFSIETLNGDVLKSQDLLEDNIIYLDFWATSCQPCLRLLPQVSNLVEKYPDVTFIAVSIDSPRHKNNVSKLVRSQKFEFITAYDSNKALQKLFNVTSIPRSIIINKKREIVFDHSGFNSGDEQEIEKALQEALKGE
ncbi:MAG: TlpA disulfide reductase family protein [Candidatus Cloacimonetes bacterium]|nr:TlpA family protein disulfide reductase [Candidatus Cloacimonadota bacterium]MDD4155436.1 TlpA disulfide reductase family protein [Candidatus Cloacimonadota bacterium]